MLIKFKVFIVKKPIILATIVILILNQSIGFCQGTLEFDVKRYDIKLDLTKALNKIITGDTKISINALKDNPLKIELNLLQLKVDSVYINGVTSVFSYDNKLLSINLKSGIKAGDQIQIRVKYSGTPYFDPSGFGGVVLNTSDSGWFYNMGVGFTVHPPSLGQAWFPCVDNFTDKALFSFEILTTPNLTAVCNGNLESIEIRNNIKYTKWKLNQQIPTYLASFAASKYLLYKTDYTTRNSKQKKDILIYNSVRFAGINAIAEHFAKLPEVLDIYEEFLCDYQFDRVGYIGIPYSGGAMEHATNIAYPASAMNSNGDISLWIHELAHHWFGDLLTCDNATSMFLNEGFASYFEGYVFEKLYNKQARVDHQQGQLLQAVWYAPAYEGALNPIFPTSADNTYSQTVYSKGAIALQTLNHTSNGSNFMTDIGGLTCQRGNSTWSYLDFKNYMVLKSAKREKFFKAWIEQGGWPEYEIANKTIIGDYPNKKVTITSKINQRGGANEYPTENLSFTAVFRNGTRQTSLVGETMSLAQEPEFIGLNLDNDLGEAVTRQIVDLSTSTNTVQKGVKMQIKKGISVLGFALIEHHFMPPVKGKDFPNNLILSRDRYWRILGKELTIVNLELSLPYDTRKTNNINVGGYLDTTFNKSKEDSLMLMYRPDGNSAWVIVTDATRNKGANSNDGVGSFVIKNFKPGDYCFALQDVKNSINYQRPKKRNLVDISVINRQLNIKSTELVSQLHIYDNIGKTVYYNYQPNKEYNLDVSDYLTGFYLITAKFLNGETNTNSIFIRRD